MFKKVFLFCFLVLSISILTLPQQASAISGQQTYYFNNGIPWPEGYFTYTLNNSANSPTAVYKAGEQLILSAKFTFMSTTNKFNSWYLLDMAPATLSSTPPLQNTYETSAWSDAEKNAYPTSVLGVVNGPYPNSGNSANCITTPVTNCNTISFNAPSVAGKYYIHLAAHTYFSGSDGKMNTSVAADTNYISIPITVLAPTNLPPSAPVITSNIPLVPPTTGSPKGFMNTPYNFTFTSKDPEGHTVQYGIDWDNIALDKVDWKIGEYLPRQGYYNSGSPAPSTHQFLKGLQQKIHARAFDLEGMSSTWSEYVFDIINRAPVAPTITAVSTNNNFTNNQQSYSIVGTDPDNDTLLYSVNWGDKSPQTDSSVAKNSGQEYVPAHTFTLPGTYTITASSTDIDITKNPLRSPSGALTVTIRDEVPPPPPPQPCQQTLPANIIGWGWSSTIGWISLGSNTQNSQGGGPYGVSIDSKNNLIGCAWSSNIGWIMFGNLVDFPEHGVEKENAKIASGKLVGWARACAGSIGGGCSVSKGNKMPSRTDGWDGWIELTGTNHQVAYTPNPLSGGEGGTLDGWAWGGDVVGWIQFIGATPQAPYCRLVSPEGSPQSYANGTTKTIRLQWNSYGAFSCKGTNFNTNNQPNGTFTESITADKTYSLSCTKSDNTPLPPCNPSQVQVIFGKADVVSDALSITVKDNGRYADVTSDSTKKDAPNYPPTAKVKKGMPFTLVGAMGTGGKFTNSQCTVTTLPTEKSPPNKDTVLSPSGESRLQSNSLVKYQLYCSKTVNNVDIEDYVDIKVQLVDPSINEF